MVHPLNIFVQRKPKPGKRRLVRMHKFVCPQYGNYLTHK